MEYPTRELFIDDVRSDDVLDLTLGGTRVGGRPRIFEIVQLDLRMALNAEADREVRVGSAPGSDTIQIFIKLGNVILYKLSNRTPRPLRFNWQSVLFKDNVTIGVGQGEVLIFYRDGYRKFEYPNNFDIRSITVEAEDVLVEFEHGERERYAKLNVTNESSFEPY